MIVFFTGEKYIAYYSLAKDTKQSVELNSDSVKVMLYSNHYDINGSAGITATVEDLMLVAGTTAPTAYTPYIGQTNTLVLPETVYGCSVNAETGEGQKEWALIASYAGEQLPGKWISDRDAYSAGRTPTIGAQVVYKLAALVPFVATGNQQIPALSGVNTVLTDADSVTVTGRADPIKRITDLEDAVASQT